ncbi:MAG: hypothetical protein ABW023_15275 [Sphingomonas sp.]
MPRLVLLPLALTFALAACDGSGTNISINAKDDEGNTLLSTDANGQVDIKVPGFSGSIRLPKIHMDAEDFEINGVKLYPGSTIDDFRADAQDRSGNDDLGKVSIRFRSPATPTAVRDWFRDNMTKQGFKVETRSNGLSGTTDDGQPFSIALDTDGDGKSKGRMQVGK